MKSIKENLDLIRTKIPEGVQVMAVVKNVPTEKIFEAIAARLEGIGENRVQEAKSRFKTIKEKFPKVKVHFIGHLQTNKINSALEMFDCLESLDSFHLAEEVSKRAKQPIEVFIEVNTSGETSKFGVEPGKALELAKEISVLPNIKLTGLMTIGALSGDVDKLRDCFKVLRGLRDKIRGSGLNEVVHLSMGMSQDFPLAIEEGSDIIRIGRALFEIL